MQRFSETLKGDKMRGRELHVLQGHCYLSHQLDSSRWLAISDQDFFGTLMLHKVSSTSKSCMAKATPARTCHCVVATSTRLEAQTCMLGTVSHGFRKVRRRS